MRSFFYCIDLITSPKNKTSSERFLPFDVVTYKKGIYTLMEDDENFLPCCVIPFNDIPSFDELTNNTCELYKFWFLPYAYCDRSNWSDLHHSFNSNTNPDVFFTEVLQYTNDYERIAFLEKNFEVGKDEDWEYDTDTDKSKNGCESAVSEQNSDLDKLIDSFLYRD